MDLAEHDNGEGQAQQELPQASVRCCAVRCLGRLHGRDALNALARSRERPWRDRSRRASPRRPMGRRGPANLRASVAAPDRALGADALAIRPGRPRQVGAGQIDPLEAGIGEIGVAQVRAVKSGAPQVGADQ